MAPIYSLLFLTALGSISGAQALSECWKSAHNNTIAFFNSAPFTYSFEVDTATNCQNWCGEVPKCQSWVYVGQSGSCDLHRTGPLSISENNGFIFGGCEPTNATQPIATTSRILIPTPSATPVESDENFLAHARREVGQRRHNRHHR